MSTIEVNKITPVSGGTAIQVGESGDTITVPSGATITNSGTANNFTSYRPNAMPLAYNGNMEVAQYGTSATGLTNGSSGYKTVDRWKWHENGSPSSVWTMTQETLTSGNAYADGFNNALKIDCTTAQGSLGAGDTLHIEQRWEKQDLGAFKKGTANAQKFTIAFWVKATKTGTNIVELQDQGNDRAVSATYTISTTDTWEHKVVTFPADTTGNFGTGNALGLILRFYIYAGTDYTSGSLQTAWGASTTTDRANGQVNNADSTSNNWHLTGFQLEVGEYTSSTLPSFQHESYGDNLARCQRYYTLIADRALGDFAMIGLAVTRSTTNCTPFFAHPVTMRTQPSIVEHDTSNVYRQNGTGNSNNDGTAPTIDQGNIQGTSIAIAGFSGLTAGEATTVKINSGGKLGLSAEL